MNFPEDVKYTKDHEWIRINGNEAHIGITEFAQGELGDIVFVDINTVGQEIKHGDLFGTIEAVKTVSDLFMPMSGEILELNPEIDAEPEQVNKDPYNKGWMIKISLTNVADADKLLTAEAYKALVH